MISKTELIKLLEELEQYHDEQANNHNDELLNNPDEYRKLAYERANGIRDCLMVIYEMDEVEAIPIEWIMKYCYEKQEQYSNTHGGFWNVWQLEVKKMIENWRKEKIRRFYEQESNTGS